MIDESIRMLCKRVETGDLLAAGMLLDRLSELGDLRYSEWLRHLGCFVNRVERIQRRGGERQEQRLHREWYDFTSGFRALFWPELADVPILTLLASTETVSEARRWASGEEPAPLPQDEEMPNLPGEGEDSDAQVAEIAAMMPPVAGPYVTAGGIGLPEDWGFSAIPHPTVVHHPLSITLPDGRHANWVGSMITGEPAYAVQEPESAVPTDT